MRVVRAAGRRGAGAPPSEASEVRSRSDGTKRRRALRAGGSGAGAGKLLGRPARVRGGARPGRDPRVTRLPMRALLLDLDDTLLDYSGSAARCWEEACRALAAPAGVDPD